MWYCLYIDGSGLKEFPPSITNLTSLQFLFVLSSIVCCEQNVLSHSGVFRIMLRNHELNTIPRSISYLTAMSYLLFVTFIQFNERNDLKCLFLVCGKIHSRTFRQKSDYSRESEDFSQNDKLCSYLFIQKYLPQ